ncbi:hypothetical protein PN836_014780 [Ningiella sp. W23]|uniref:hypothetical protein n=1 Tax=Ningiella sp. W23 TaxID=3023715 RepID=UPI0037575763
MTISFLKRLVTALVSAISLVSISYASNADDNMACFDESMAVIIEIMDNNCEQGDIVITASPALYCDFNSQIIEHNEKGTRFICKYIGEKRKLRDIPAYDDLENDD